MQVLPVVETFYSIQGEGFYCGKAAFFIRLAGCDIVCHWCDTPYSWNINNGKNISIKKLLNIAKEYKSKHIVVTGGEPFTYNLETFTKLFKENKYYLQVETNGTKLLTGNWDWIVFSPKKWTQPLDCYFKLANELKIIVADTSDFQWAQYCKTKINSFAKLYLQPEYSVKNKIIPEIINFIKNNPEWNISLQIHKILNIP
ncbi:MAG: 7-carboxy-7-deazaguanine synthase QueE [Bacteroidales bacterium]|nr:7-carboxy-7-deazaguanine synthase QueE [Bacteroidales bacterium]